MCRPLAVTSAASKAGLVSPSGLVNGSVRKSNFAPSRLIRISSTRGKTRERRSTIRPDFWTNRCRAASSAWARSPLGEGKSLRPRFSMDSENSERCVDFARHDKEEKQVENREFATKFRVLLWQRQPGLIATNTDARM